MFILARLHVIGNPPTRQSVRRRVGLMGRHGRMAAAQLPEEPENERERLIRELEAENAAENKAPHAEITDMDRYKRLTSFTIKRPDSPLAREAIIRAAVVWVCTDKKSDKRDEDAVKFLANYLFLEGLYWGSINERRALPRQVVDSWLKTTKLNATTARTYQAILREAGRVLYPGEYEKPNAPVTPRGRATRAASENRVRELYGIAASLHEPFKLRLLVVLDLTTAAGLRTEEILQLRGSDLREIELSKGRRVVGIRVRRRGRGDREVLVTCSIRAQRLLSRAKDVGRGYFMPTPSGSKPHKNSVNGVFTDLKERGHQSATVPQLRNYWQNRLADRVPATMLLSLCGQSSFSNLADQIDDLPRYSLEEIAEFLFDDREEQ